MEYCDFIQDHNSTVVSSKKIMKKPKSLVRVDQENPDFKLNSSFVHSKKLRQSLDFSICSDINLRYNRKLTSIGSTATRAPLSVIHQYETNPFEKPKYVLSMNCSKAMPKEGYDKICKIFNPVIQELKQQPAQPKGPIRASIENRLNVNLSSIDSNINPLRRSLGIENDKSRGIGNFQTIQSNHVRSMKGVNDDIKKLRMRPISSVTKTKNEISDYVIIEDKTDNTPATRPWTSKFMKPQIGPTELH